MRKLLLFGDYIYSYNALCHYTNFSLLVKPLAVNYPKLATRGDLSSFPGLEEVRAISRTASPVRTPLSAAWLYDFGRYAQPQEPSAVVAMTAPRWTEGQVANNVFIHCSESKWEVEFGYRYLGTERSTATRYTKMATPYVTDESGKGNARCWHLSTTNDRSLNTVTALCIYVIALAVCLFHLTVHAVLLQSFAALVLVLATSANMFAGPLRIPRLRLGRLVCNEFRLKLGILFSSNLSYHLQYLAERSTP